MLVLGYGTMVAPAVQSRGWWAAAPRPVLAVMLPWIPSPVAGAAPSRGSQELETRRAFLSGPWELRGLWPGEAWLTRWCARRALSGQASEPAQMLASELLVLLSEDAVAAAPQAGRARVVLARSSLGYARCNAYRDIGLVKGTIGVRDEKPFITAFRRPAEFRFEALLGHPHERMLSMRYVVWAAQGAVRSWWTLGPTINEHMDIYSALAGPTGVSGGAASNVPSQLLRGRSWISVLRAPGITAVESFDGRQCYVIRGQDSLDLPCDVWIDAETFLIRKIHQHWERPSITVYRPEFAAPDDASMFEFDPASKDQTPLGNGGAVSSELRQLAGDPLDGAVPVPENKRMPLRFPKPKSRN
ncbi:MAG: hypothetical protein KF745_09810 [Phycisphaeraceae bacterium]|nr:hypothetical protein [Phycisphaeraceae bacterium]